LGGQRAVCATSIPSLRSSLRILSRPGTFASAPRWSEIDGKTGRNEMKARLFGIIALAMVPTLALAADAGGAAKPDNAKAAGTGGGEGAAAASSTNDGSGKVGAQGAAAASQSAPGSVTTPSSRDAAGTGGGEGAKTKPEKTP
jgi:hypothetical protein